MKDLPCFPFCIQSLSFGGIELGSDTCLVSPFCAWPPWAALATQKCHLCPLPVSPAPDVALPNGGPPVIRRGTSHSSYM